MKHSLKELALCVNVQEKEEDLAVAMVPLCSALSEHHTSLLCLELAYIQLDNYSAIQPLTLLLRHSKNLQRLGLWFSAMSRHTVEMFCSAVQANKSLTALHLAFAYLFIKRHSRLCTPTHTGHRDWIECPGVTAATDHPWAPENQDDRHVYECIQQVSHVAVHHESITRLEIGWAADDEWAMSIVREVLKTKGKPHQLTQLSFLDSELTEEGADRLREVIQSHELNLTVAVTVHSPFFRGYGGPIVRPGDLPLWKPNEK